MKYFYLKKNLFNLLINKLRQINSTAKIILEN